ncbi:MAG: zinc-binding alcohol dehydrogenase [Clostridia bacterium]|nr:zinc-binding alcohol dehydrogenase [Clostridia bacterium]
MKRKQIIFTKPKTAELLDTEIFIEKPTEVMVKMEYTVVSGGTEKANLLGLQSVSGVNKFPVSLGYCGVGTVVDIGEAVTKCKIGDRVLVYHGVHSNYNVREEKEIFPVYDPIDSLEAAFIIIAAMGLGGVRKLEAELGESAMVFGLGLLGMFSVEFMRISGLYPIIAVDPDKSRRELSLKLGADFALDPTSADLNERVLQITENKRVKNIVEVTGVGRALEQALENVSGMGKISLLGCTRISDMKIDYYKQVHCPGVKLIGAHNFVRPKLESYPHHWTMDDDCRAISQLIYSKRIDVKSMISRICDPKDSPQIYDELVNSNCFPMGTVFDWRELE